MISSSFSLKIGQAINGGNGYGIVESETEYDDNSWDANSDIICKIATPYNEDYGQSYSIHYDLGKSTSDPRNILGIGSQIKKKIDGDIGIKIMGALSALCRYNPDKFYCFCKVAGDYPKIMEYMFGAHVKEIQRVMDSGSRDYRDVDKWCEETNVISPTQTAFGNNIFDHPVIQQVYNTIQNNDIKEEFKRITSGGQDHYTILINVYNSPLPADIPEGIEKTLTLSKMLYSKQLLAGKRIMYLDPSNILDTLTSENAITPLGDATKFARVLCKIGVYELQDGVCFRVNVHTEDSRGISTDSKQFHITDSQQLIANRSCKVKLITDEVVIPSNAINRGDMTLNNSCLSLAAQDEQTRSLETADLGTRDSLRGLYCDYNRILGLPFWSTGKNTWGAVRNAGGIRSILSFTSQWVAENIVCILCEKQRTNLANAHPVLKTLFDVVINKTIIKNYSGSTPTRDTSAGVKDWNLNKLYSQMTGIVIPQAPIVPVVVAPVVQGLPHLRRYTSIADDNSSVSDASSVTSMESASSSDNDTATRQITFELAIRELIIMNTGREVARFNNYGNGSGLRDWLKAVYDTKNDDDFIRWIRVFKSINVTHTV